jgi:hypothetical protein
MIYILLLSLRRSSTSYTKENVSNHKTQLHYSQYLKIYLIFSKYIFQVFVRQINIKHHEAHLHHLITNIPNTLPRHFKYLEIRIPFLSNFI